MPHLPPDSAASAVRNLNDHDIMGRKLRVDFSNDNNAQGNNDDSGPHDRNQSRPGNNYNNQPPSNGADMPSGGPLPPLPAGITLPPGVTITDHISRTLNTLPPTQLLDILTSMKQLCVTDPARAGELLTQAPQLSYAVFQALLLMGLVSPEAINSVLEPGSVPPPPAPSAAPVGYPPAPTPTAYAPTPTAYAPPPSVAPTPVAQHAAPVAEAAAPDPNSDALIQQVLSLPEEVIAALPEAERAQILQLRAQFAGQRV